MSSCNKFSIKLVEILEKNSYLVWLIIHLRNRIDFTLCYITKLFAGGKKFFAADENHKP